MTASRSEKNFEVLQWWSFVEAQVWVEGFF